MPLRLLFEALFALVLEETVKKYLPRYLREAWMLIFTVFTWEFLTWDYCEKMALRVAIMSGTKNAMWSYFGVGVVGTALFIFYWWGIQQALRIADEKTIPLSPHAPLPPSEPLKPTLPPNASRPPHKVSPSINAPHSSPRTADPEIKLELAKQMVRLADELSQFATRCQKIEEQLPFLDPNLPLGTGKTKYLNNPAAREWDVYHGRVGAEFQGKRRARYSERCERIIKSLPPGLPEQEVSYLTIRCTNFDKFPRDAEDLRNLSSLLARMAKEVEELP